VKKRLSNRSEQRLHDELLTATETFGAGIYRKIRIADVVDIAKLDFVHGRYALQAHFDICVCDADEMPAFAIEFDGGGHDPRRDAKKDDIARQADLALFRIDETLLARRIGPLTFLQYLVHLWFMGRAFREAQNEGQIAYDEPFVMGGFLKPDARHVFDSEYDFARPPLVRVGRALRRAGLLEGPFSRSMIDMSNMIIGRDDTSFVAFAHIPVDGRHRFGRGRIDIGTPYLGELADLPFAWAGLADFCEGMAIDDLADGLEIEERGGHHVQLRDAEVEAEIAILLASGYRAMRAQWSNRGSAGTLFARAMGIPVRS
jgi:hypothetical protein